MHYTVTLFKLILCICFVNICVYAKTYNVNKVNIIGNERVDSEAIKAHIVYDHKAQMTDEGINTTLSNLYELGYFKDVKVTVKNKVLVITVKENPSVNVVAFEGNDELSDDVLKAETNIRPRNFFTVSAVKNAVKKIKRIYRYKGYFLAKVEPKIINRPQNRVDIVFEIDEDKKTKVGKIVFIGNNNFSNSELSEIIQTKESRWYRFFSSDDSYDPDRVSYDKELLRLFYLKNGYADFQVKSAVTELTLDNKEFYITFTIDEGDVYNVGKITINSDKLKKIKKSELLNAISFKTGDVYNNYEVEKTISALTNVLGKKGYAFVDIIPNVTKNYEQRTIDLSFDLEEGPQVYVEKINIVGNIVTDDDVIRREILFYEGDAFNTDKLKKSERRIRNLGFFKNVKISKSPGRYPDRINITIELEEERTGELSVAGGFSTLDGLQFQGKYAEHNFRGRGQDISISFTLAKKSSEFDISFTEPYFMNRDIAVGVDLYNTSRTSEYKTQNDTGAVTDKDYKHKTTGGGLRVGYSLSENIAQRVSYHLRKEEISGVTNAASRYIAEQKGKNIVSEVSQSLSYDKRDSKIVPRKGYVIGFSNNFAGLGGNIKFLKNSIFGSYYHTIKDDWVLSVSGRYNVMFDIGKTTRIVDRYSLGGESLRGFEINGVDPRDKKTKDPLGGLYSYTVSTELLFPIGLPNEFGIRGAVFSDAGCVWKTPKGNKGDVISSTKPRVAIGCGLRWRSPLGPLKIDYTHAVLKEKYDKTQQFLFGVSTRF